MLGLAGGGVTGEEIQFALAEAVANRTAQTSRLFSANFKLEANVEEVRNMVASKLDIIMSVG